MFRNKIAAIWQNLIAPNNAHQELEHLHTAIQALGNSLHLPDVLENILTELHNIVPYDTASIQKFIAPQHLEIISGYGFSNLESIIGSQFDMTTDDHPSHHIIESRTPLLLADAPSHFTEFSCTPHNENVIHSWLGVPLLFDDQIKGVLTLGKQEVGFYTQEHADLVSSFAAHASIAIENARLYGKSQQRAFELETLAQISASLRTVASVPEMMPILLQKTVEAIKADYGVLFLVDRETGDLVSQLSNPPDFYCSGMRLSSKNGITGHVATTRKIYTIKDIKKNPISSACAVEQNCFQNTRSILSAPLQTTDRIVGVIHIGTIEKRTFSKADISLITSVSNIAANALTRTVVKDALEERVADRTRELAEANARLKELDSLKTKFISDISHELRTPVATLNLHMDLLERGKPENKPRYMAILRQKTDILVRLTEDILNVSRLRLYDGELQFTELDLNDPVTIVIDVHKERAEAAGINLKFIPAIDLLPIRAERNQLMQAINNIIINALNYTSAGSVQVRTYSLPDSGCNYLEISDTGIGVDPEDIPYIFDRFYRGKSVAQSNLPGTGLGLSIVKEIVDLHKGAITTESELGEGSIFLIKFPAFISVTEEEE